MSELTRPIAELAADVRSGKVTSESLVQASLDRIKELDSYHAILEVNPAALEQAQAIDAAVKAGKDPGRLAGVPYIAKDNFLTLGTHTTAAAKILEPFKAPYQATAINKLQTEGAIMVAKANLDAFAHGSSTENSDYGATKNPWDSALVPGGSSGGSAAAVALGLASFALGTDTGGSIRLPASYCGVVGYKPTYGLVSRSGVIAMASSTDVIGPLTRSVADAGLVLEVLAGRDMLDATTIDRDPASYADAQTDLKGLKIGVIKEYLQAEGVDPEVQTQMQQTVDKLTRAGAVVTEVNIPEVDLALACYYIIVPAEISSNLERYDGVKYGFSASEAKTLAETYDLSRDQGLGAEAKRRILIGTYVLSSGYYDAYYKKAQAVRSRLIEAFDRAHQSCDVLLAPTAAGGAFALGSRANPLAMYATDLMTVAVNLTGASAVSIPVGLTSAGLPIGLQLIAPQRQDRQLLGAAQAVESLINFTAKPKVVA